MENVKIFEVRGEYRMSEEDNFKTARKFALESAEKNLLQINCPFRFFMLEFFQIYFE